MGQDRGYQAGSDETRTKKGREDMDQIYRTKAGQEMEESAIYARNIQKKYGGFQLSIPQLEIPKGFATALIGENGAGKTTLLNILSGIRLDFQGEVYYFGSPKPGLDGSIQERIGYTGTGSYFLPHWTIRQVEELNALLFSHFHKDRFASICEELGLGCSDTKSVKKLSDGTRMKLMLAAVLSRDTQLLILDEPASPLDPLMREQLCGRMREYLDAGGGERSIFFSTHNIADMENVTDYCLIMEQGTIVEQGSVEDLKEKYVLVKGEAADAAQAGNILYSMDKGAYGFEGICLAQDLDRLAGLDVCVEIPTLSQICLSVMKHMHKVK